MEKSINALLDSNLRVIIPDFGAFIIRQKEPRIVVFNEFLRYNDGLLTDFIAKTEGIEQETALQRVSDFTITINKILDSGQSYILEGLGKLHKDSTGKIIFDFESKVAAAGKAVKDISEPPVPARPKAKPAARQKPKRAPKPVSEPVEQAIVPEAPAEPPLPESPVPEPQEATVPEAEEILPRDNFEMVTETVGEAAESKSEGLGIPVGGNESEPVPPDMEKPAYISFNLILKWVVVILLVNVVILGWFVFGDNIRGLFRKKAEPAELMDSLFNSLSDSVKEAAMDTAIVFGELPEFSQASDSATVRQLRYYIVAGCFRDEVNADDLVRSLKSRGFNAEKFGKIGNLHAVSFASFDEKESAVKELKRIRGEIQPEAWMTRF